MPASHTRATRALPLLAALVLAACGGGDRPGGEAEADADVPDSARYGGTVTVAGYGDLQSMNALTSSDNNSGSIQREVLFMPLVKYDADINPVPWLAERWDTTRVAGDSLDLTFHIRRDVKWHDGRQTTARDVLFSFTRAKDPATAFPNAENFQYYNPVGTLVDEYTVRFRMKPHSDFLDAWYQMPSMPEHILGNVAPGDLLKHPFGTSQPVGNGPFRFVRRQQGQEWVFEANPDFPEALGGRPYVDRIVYRFVPEMTTLLTELLTGRLDIYLGPNPNQAEQIRAAPNLSLETSAFRQWVYIGWNGRSPLFSDARTRRALTMAIDRQQIVDALLYGLGDVGRSPVTPAHWSYNADDPQVLLPYDTAQAKRLLAEAGWQDRDNNGILENAQGLEFRFELKTNQGNEVRKDISEIVQAQLRPLGIVVEPRLVEWNTLIQQLQGAAPPGGGDRTRNFDAVISSWVDYFRKDDASILHCRNLNEPYQYVGYCNPQADRLIDTVAVMMDRDAALPFWQQYQRLMVQESPYTVVYYPQRITGVNRRLRGTEMDIRGEFVNAHRWWIHPSQRRAGGNVPSAAAPTDSGAAKQ